MIPGAIVLLCAAACLPRLRRRSAAERHLLWAAAVATAAALPLLSLYLPLWQPEWIRGVMAALAHDPIWLVPIQILDACGAGTLGVAVPVIVADLTWGTGRTQSALGIVATLGGLLAARFGWEAAFLGLALPAVLALVLAMRLFGQASSANAAAISARV